MTASTATIKTAADQLARAYSIGQFCEPVRHIIGPSVEAAYAVQQMNTDRWLAEGRRISGHKIGLTAAAVQKQLGVSQPDFGVLFADMEISHGEEIPFNRLQQPRIEAEIAFILGQDIDKPDPTPIEVARSVSQVCPALEIVGSRIANWDIQIADTIADNASSGLYVIGGPIRELAGLDLIGCGMTLRRNGQPVSYGAGAACLGSPLTAAVWLARKLASLGTPLQAGEVIMTGALGPMVPVAPGDVFETTITGIGSASVSIGAFSNLGENSPSASMV